ncbi:hypothetical protein GCM10022291_00050 [Postechiella marina]|uniref:Secretion system C-terminal sorting domain-containing protein n=1 Tax=Postechiella marina TaxID=943941 RepID=A0ABP8BY41_9FLAO
MIQKLFFALLTSTFMFAQTSPTKTWVTQPPSTVTMGESYPLSASFDAGDDGAGLDHTVGGTNSANLQYSIQIWNSDTSKWTWKKGKNDLTVANTHTGTSSIDWVIPTDLMASADLPANEAYFMRVGYQNSANQWASYVTGNDVAITIESAPLGDSWDWNPASVTYPSSATMDIDIIYSSDMPIAPNGIKFTLWTITDGTVNDVNLFSDIWYGLFSNPTELDPGTDMTTTITINIPNSAKNNGTMRPSSDLGANWDPNAGDQGNNYISHQDTPAPIYTFQFRPIAGDDTNFAPASLPAQNNFTVSPALSVKNIKANTLSMYPNPVKNILNLSNINNVKTFTISNALGQEVLKLKAQNSINISSLKKGLYFLKTDTGITRKIIKN